MVSHQCGRVEKGEKAVDDHGERNAELADRFGGGNALAIGMHEDLCQRRPSEEYSKKRRTADECEKVSVIPAANTVVEPDTVMILGFNTVVAKAAVMGTRRPPDITRPAVLGRDLHCGSGWVGGLDQSPFGGRGRKP